MAKVRTALLISAGVLVCAAAAGFATLRMPVPAPAVTEVSYVADFNDPRRLVGTVENVFVGRVVAESGTKHLDKLPETQFQVEVLENIKGTLKGSVTVNQQGGLYEDASANVRQTVLVENDPLLKPGQVYLFATLPHAEMGWHTLVPVFGDIMIKDDGHRQELVTKFTRARQEAITNPARAPGQ